MNPFFLKEIFEFRRKWNVPVVRSRSKLLNQYIQEAISTMKDWIAKDLVDKVVVAVVASKSKVENMPNNETNNRLKSSNALTVENFVFELGQKSASQQSTTEETKPQTKSISDLQQTFRAFLLMLNSVNSVLKKQPTKGKIKTK